jgi:hypothetical protein
MPHRGKMDTGWHIWLLSCVWQKNFEPVFNLQRKCPAVQERTPKDMQVSSPPLLDDTLDHCHVPCYEDTWSTCGGNAHGGKKDTGWHAWLLSCAWQKNFWATIQLVEEMPHGGERNTGWHLRTPRCHQHITGWHAWPLSCAWQKNFQVTIQLAEEMLHKVKRILDDTWWHLGVIGTAPMVQSGIMLGPRGDIWWWSR